MKSNEILRFIQDKKYRKKILQKIEKNSKFMNKIFSKVVDILVSTQNKTQKIESLLKLKDHKKKKLLSTKEVGHILTLEKPIIKWHSKIYSLRKQHLQNLKSGKGLLFNTQKGGNQSPEKPKITLFDWIFFPLWSIEQTPYGGLLEVSLDITELILENLDPIIGAIAPFIPDALSIAVDAGQAIPGVGTALAPIGIGLNVLDEPLEFLIANTSDIIGLLINISRKNWTLALVSLLEVIPNFDSVMDMVTTNIYYMNKYLEIFNSKINIILPILDNWTPIATAVLKSEPNKIQENIMKMNSEDIVNLLQNVPASPLINQ